MSEVDDKMWQLNEQKRARMSPLVLLEDRYIHLHLYDLCHQTNTFAPKQGPIAAINTEEQTHWIEI